LFDLQVANEDKVLERHIKKDPLNAQYTFRYIATMMIETIDTGLRGSCCKA